MDRTTSVGIAPARPSSRPGLAIAAGLGMVVVLGGAAAVPGFDLDTVWKLAYGIGRSLVGWYDRTPAGDRVTWGGLIAASFLGLGIVMERAVRLRRRKILPEEFINRFLGRLKDGRIDRGKALDFWELNPSPASRIALAAVKRWGRPVADLERAVNLAHRLESSKIRKNVGTLRRLAALAPLLGLLGSLLAIGRMLGTLGQGNLSIAWGPALASSLSPLTAGVAMAILTLLAFDGLSVRAESLVSALDLVGAETIDVVAMSLPAEPRTAAPSAKPARTPHQIRIEAPHPPPRPVVDDRDFD